MCNYACKVKSIEKWTNLRLRWLHGCMAFVTPRPLGGCKGGRALGRRASLFPPVVSLLQKLGNREMERGGRHGGTVVLPSTQELPSFSLFPSFLVVTRHRQTTAGGRREERGRRRGRRKQKKKLRERKRQQKETQNRPPLTTTTTFSSPPLPSYGGAANSNSPTLAFCTVHVQGRFMHTLLPLAVFPRPSPGGAHWEGGGGGGGARMLIPSSPSSPSSSLFPACK